MGDLQELEALAELGVNQEQELDAVRMGPAKQFCDLPEEIVGMVFELLQQKDNANLRLTSPR